MKFVMFSDKKVHCRHVKSSTSRPVSQRSAFSDSEVSYYIKILVSVLG